MKARKNCRLCNSRNLVPVIDLGDTPLAGTFLKAEEVGREKYYPLQISRCRDCSAVQLLHTVPKEELFQSFLSSVAMTKHFEDYAEELVKKDLIRPGNFVVEIGSNDGVLLKPLKDLGMKVLGIDPIESIARIARKKGIKTINEFFSWELAKKIGKKADMVLANNVFAHIDDLDEVMKGIQVMLKDDGLFVFEVHFLVDMVEKLQYDTIYHEHMNYFSIASLAPFLKKYGFEILEVKRIPTHSGSIRVYAKQFPPERLRTFVDDVVQRRLELMNLLFDLRDKDKTIVGYGAAGRANTLLNYCRINENLISCIIDESPARYDKYTPGSHIPVLSPDKVDLKAVDYVLILAWNYKDQIIQKARDVGFKGKFIVPLPKVEII